MLGPMAKKNLLRLRRIPQPSPLYRMFSKATWIVVLCMSLLGMLIRFAPVASGLRGTILIAVGIAMLIWATAYLKNIRLATPLAQPDSAPPKTLQTKTAS